TVVGRALLAPEAVGPLATLVEASRLLTHLASVLEKLRLPLDLVLDGSCDVLERVEVLDLHLGAELLSRAAQRDVDVGPQLALLRSGIRHGYGPGYRANLSQQFTGVVGRAEVGLGDHLDQRRPSAIEVDEAVVGVRRMYQPSGVL